MPRFLAPRLRLGDDVATPDAFAACPANSCGYGFVTIFQDNPPQSAARSVKLTGGEYRNYYNGSTGFKTMYVPEGFRAVVLYDYVIDNFWNGKAGGWIRVAAYDGPQTVVFDTVIDPALYIGPGLMNDLSIDWTTGALLNFPMTAEKGKYNAPKGEQSRVAHIQATDMRSDELKARQFAESNRRVQVVALETESHLAELESNFAEQAAAAAKKTAEQLQILRDEAAAREQIRQTFTTEQAAASANQVSALIQATENARLEDSRKVSEAIARQDAAIQAQYATPWYKNPITWAVAAALGIAAAIKMRK